MIRDKRRHEIKVRYDDHELATLKAASSAARVPLAVYIRERSFGRTPKPPANHPAIVGDLINELLKIATNFSQLARWAEGDALTSVNAWERIMREDCAGRMIRGDFDKEAAAEHFGALVEQGRCINAIAKDANTERKWPDSRELEAATKALNSVVFKIFPPKQRQQPPARQEKLGA